MMLPEGTIVRKPCMDDLQAVADLVNTADTTERGASDFTAGDLFLDWHTPGFSLDKDAWAVKTQQNGKSLEVDYEEL